MPTTWPSPSRLIFHFGLSVNRDNIEDVIRLLQEKGEDVRKFATVELSRLLPTTLDSVDVSIMLNSIKKMENEMTIMKDSLKTVHNTTSLLKDTTSTLNARVSTLESEQMAVISNNVHAQRAQMQRGCYLDRI